uniref:Putative lipocalin-3 1 n=1 Tax=Amblyomma cajennense TaxID=34607 RepID=A0A023FUD2_AMBCJ
MAGKKITSALLITLVVMVVNSRAETNSAPKSQANYANLLKFLNTTEAVLIFSLKTRSDLQCGVDNYRDTTSTNTFISRSYLAYSRGQENHRANVRSSGRSGMQWHPERLEGQFTSYKGFDAMNTFKGEQAYTTEVLDSQQEKCAIFTTRATSGSDRQDRYEVRVWRSAIKDDGQLECSSFVEKFITKLKNGDLMIPAQPLISKCKQMCLNGPCRPEGAEVH